MKINRESLNLELIGVLIISAMFGVSFFMTGAPLRERAIPPDKVIHAVSGAGLAFAFSAYFKKRGNLILFIFFVGLVFEAAEFWSVPFGVYGDADRYVIDTVLDLAVDVLGGLAALQFLRASHA